MWWGNDRLYYGQKHIPRTVLVLLILNVAIYFIQIILDALLAHRFTAYFALSTGGFFRGYVWQLVSYMFLHGSPLHLFLNMLVLYFIGPETERAMGTRHFLSLYFLSGILGGLGWVLIGPTRPCVGASGAIFGILGAFATMFPHRRITLLLFFILPITMKAWIIVTSLALMELAFLLGAAGGNIAYAVHLGGVIVGFLYAWITYRGGRIPFVKGPRLRVLPGGRGREPSDDDIDRILEKIGSKGIGSLTSRERAVLESASKSRNSRF